jgi:hypothetical protein
MLLYTQWSHVVRELPEVSDFLIRSAALQSDRAETLFAPGNNGRTHLLPSKITTVMIAIGEIEIAQTTALCCSARLTK